MIKLTQVKTAFAVILLSLGFVSISLFASVPKPQQALAATDCASFEECTDVPAPIDAGGEFPTRESGFIGVLINAILPVAIGLGAFLSVIMIVISGIQFISSNGSPEGAAAARGRLTFALVGLALLGLAYGITRVVDSVFLNNSGVF